MINKQSELSRWYIDYREVSAQLSRICRGYGLGLDELLFLEQLTINGTQLPGQLAETFKMSHPGITRKLNLLQERNLVKKIRGERQDLRLVAFDIFIQRIHYHLKNHHPRCCDSVIIPLWLSDEII
ncbi:MarR family transcriptional regulator [Latilactobacillus curvatus]|uniref:MarR family transcriptional regulator n=1 Tax=Latilactobacillus curvatus TaxID=28038 RepID=UPI0039AF8229